MTAFEASASQVGQIGNGVRHPAPTFIGLVEPRSGVGHEDQFQPPRLSASSRFRKETIAGSHGNEQDAPKRAVHRMSGTDGTRLVAVIHPGV